jgi:glycosyltransferase involved in cell wall biosynthesis
MFDKKTIDKFRDLNTPFYYYDLDILKATCATVRKESDLSGYKVHYAVKSNANPKILKTIASFGFGADCVSWNEIERAIESGFNPSEIVFAGVGKTDRDIESALKADIFCFNCESIPEIEVINHLASIQNKTASIKGVDVLLRAFREVHGQRPGRAELHVLGDFESEEFAGELRELARGLPVTFHGAFDAAQLHAARPHVGMFPSTCIETFGLVLDECFELGLPCVTSDLGALPERAGAAGLCTRAGDAADLTRAMLRFVDEPQLRDSLRQHLPEPSPDLDAHVDALTAIYDRVRVESAAGSFADAVPQSRRIGFLMQQRESALGRCIPPGGPR